MVPSINEWKKTINNRIVSVMKRRLQSALEATQPLVPIGWRQWTVTTPDNVKINTILLASGLATKLSEHAMDCASLKEQADLVGAPSAASAARRARASCRARAARCAGAAAAAPCAPTRCLAARHARRLAASRGAARLRPGCLRPGCPRPGSRPGRCLCPRHRPCMPSRLRPSTAAWRRGRDRGGKRRQLEMRC